MENEKKYDAVLDEIGPDEMELVNGGEMTPEYKEKMYKVIRKAIENGATKEEFINRHPKYMTDLREFIDNVWEVVEITSFEKAKKHNRQ